MHDARKAGFMKSINIIVSVIVVAAVLLAAYAVGLFIRQGRIENQRDELRTVDAPGETARSEAAVGDAQPGPSHVRRSADVDPKQIKEARARQLEKMDNLTEEEKQEFRERIRSRFGSSKRFQNMPPAEREKMVEKWQNMSDEEKRAFLEKMAARFRTVPERRPSAASDASQEDGTVNEEGAAENGSEPNQPDQG